MVNFQIAYVYMTPAESRADTNLPPPATTPVDAAWFGVIPVIAWALAYAHEVGKFLKHGVPIAFIELSLSQVVNAAVTLLFTVYLFGIWVERFRTYRRRRAAAITAYVVLFIFIAVLIYFSKRSTAADLTISALVSVGVLTALLFISWSQHRFLGPIKELRKLLSQPTLGGLLNVLAIAAFFGVAALGIGYQGSILSAAPVVQDSGCGPVPQLVAKAGDVLILKLPSEQDRPTAIRLLSAADARAVPFRNSNVDEIHFRNVEFVGPCYRERGSN